MVYTRLTNRAMNIAYAAHHGQLDPNGVPYIFHPCHLAEQMEDEVSCCVALLHDVVEDTDVTLEDLAKEFPPEVVEGVAAMTHRKNEDYFDYVRRVKTNPVALKVKLADLAHNSNQNRCDGVYIAQKRKDRWKAKYAKALEILTE